MSDNTLTYQDHYCERTGTGLWQEPFNAVTNIAFIIAAICVWYILRRQPTRLKTHGDIYLLILLLAAIGIGSALWHLNPNGTTLLGDVFPILLFINLYLVSFLRRLMQLRWHMIFCLWLAYQALTFASETWLNRDLLNGTVMYLPTYLTLALMTLALWKKRHPRARRFGALLLLWTASLTFRTLDQSLCMYIPMGTHFLWHLFNALVLGGLIHALIKPHPTEKR